MTTELTHQQARRYLQATADKRLEADNQNALERHLASCADCRSYAAQLNALEGGLRNVFHKQWDAQGKRSINLVPAVRAGYRRKRLQRRVTSLASALASVGMLTGLAILIGWAISMRQTTPLAPATNTPTDNLPSGVIAFVSNRDELDDLYTMNADGTGQKKMFEDNLHLSLFPAWSPDGKQIAFVYQETNSEIYLINIDSQGLNRLIQLTNDPAEDSHPAWSPDGKRIAFTSDRSGYVEIYAMDADGSNLTRLTNTQAANNHPAWSPDGQHIAFASNRDGYWQIYVMNADGSQPVNLSSEPQSDDREPAWSPDGQRLVFSAKRVGETNQHLYILNADGTGRVELTPNPPEKVQPCDDFQPAWSPDGQWIAFNSYRDNTSEGEVYVLRADGSQVIRLTTQGGSQPTWKP